MKKVLIARDKKINKWVIFNNEERKNMEEKENSLDIGDEATLFEDCEEYEKYKKDLKKEREEKYETVLSNWLSNNDGLTILKVVRNNAMDEVFNSLKFNSFDFSTDKKGVYVLKLIYDDKITTKEPEIIMADSIEEITLEKEDNEELSEEYLSFMKNHLSPADLKLLQLHKQLF